MKKQKNDQQIDHRVIKFLVGIIAIFIAFFIQKISGKSLDSISESYHYISRDWFVGLLFAVAALIFSFTGENRLERILTILAGVFAATVALAPCECGRTPGPLSFLHFPAAGGLFAILGYFCWRFRRSAQSKIFKYQQAKTRVHLYSVCLVGMAVCWLMAIIYAVAKTPLELDEKFPSYIFWLEAIGLVSFGVSWLAASRIFPFLSNEKERFSIRNGGAPDDVTPQAD